MLAGASAVLLAVFMWRKVVRHRTGNGGSRTGWQALTDLRWLLLVTIIAAVALVLAQARRRAPAIPVTMSLVVMLLGLISVVALIYRVLINAARAPAGGAYLGLLWGLDRLGWLSLAAPGGHRPAGRAAGYPDRAAGGGDVRPAPRTTPRSSLVDVRRVCRLQTFAWLCPRSLV